MAAIFFEWAEHEKEVSTDEGIEWEGVEFSPDIFTLEASKGFEIISLFVDSEIKDGELRELAKSGTKVISIRAAGYDMLNLELAKELGISVYRVSSYSPESIAEHTFALLLAIARRLNIQREQHEEQSNIRTAESMGFSLRGKVIGIYGVGKIGKIVSEIALGFGMKVKFFDPYVEELTGAEKLNSLTELITASKVLSIHVPLVEETRFAINEETLSHAKPGLVLLNVSRGDIVDSNSVIKALDSGLVSGVGVDVWDTGVVDDKYDERLLRDNVIQTYHVAYFTHESITQILLQTEENISGTPREENII